MRKLLHTECFEAAARAIPTFSEWLEPDVSEPVSEVHSMGKINNSRRFFVVDGKPLALGILPVGDALIHTNPLNGRGCSFAFIHAFLISDALRAHSDDLESVALKVEEDIVREIVPWYESTLAQDRDAIDVGEDQSSGEDPFDYTNANGSIDPKKYMRAILRDGLLPGLREDIELLRVFMRAFNLLDPASDLMKRPDLLTRVMASYARKDQREPVDLGPSRKAMVDILDASRAA
jgi:flavin-dependent dehydrogenase